MTEKYALGTFNMLCDALRRHNREHYNRPPRRFILHPVVYRELVSEITDHRRGYLKHMPDGSITFMGILLIVDSAADQPKLITFQNVVEYL